MISKLNLEFDLSPDPDIKLQMPKHTIQLQQSGFF